jgi:2-dehydro-3-deoxygluconokinase
MSAPVDRLSGEIDELKIRKSTECRWDLISLGEVMLRLDPGDTRIATARMFRAWEGGGEYNVARGLRRCFGLRTSVVTALVENPVGRLIEDLMLQGGVDLSHVHWVKDDGVGRCARNGINFTDRGFGIRAAQGCSDRANSAASQIRPGDLDWDRIFGNEGARWFHTGGIFCALSQTTPDVAIEAMRAARRHGVVISYDLNYRESLWKSWGGRARAIEVNRKLAPLVDVMLGNEEDFTSALGFSVEQLDENFSCLDTGNFRRMIENVVGEYSNLKVVATTLRKVTSATANDWGAVCYCSGSFYEARQLASLEILDRVGGGDSFASGLIYGFLSGRDPQYAVDCGCAHGALAMTTPGDTSMAALNEVERVMRGGAARVQR